MGLCVLVKEIAFIDERTRFLFIYIVLYIIYLYVIFFQFLKDAIFNEFTLIALLFFDIIG
ncbi:hypothetical protein SAMN05192529_13415 [Arachidicoccus rhizosphaerae]|uniref:Uncharacterized protein n=1 Tax=Arachidicoccus rhizosphaerae TaxID=551991 RepID=A0A1H4CNZ3_9BACT|nr:hypothetical protein SAMN05192529_13415 [Arachidicoccus rhizosphaerae]